MAVLSFFNEHSFKDLLSTLWNGNEDNDNESNKPRPIFILVISIISAIIILTTISNVSIGPSYNYYKQGNVNISLRCGKMNNGGYDSWCNIVYPKEIGFVDYFMWPLNHSFNKNGIDTGYSAFMLYNDNDGEVYVEVKSGKISSVTHKAFVKLSDLRKVFDAPDINSLVDTKMTHLDENVRLVRGFSAEKNPI